MARSFGPALGFAKRLERALKIARGEPLVIDGRAERITPDVDYQFGRTGGGPPVPYGSVTVVKSTPSCAM